MGSQVAERHEKSLAKNMNFHYIILTRLLYQVRTLTSHDTEESENCLLILPKAYLGEIKHMGEQCVPGAPPFIVHAGDEAISIRSTRL